MTICDSRGDIERLSGSIEAALDTNRAFYGGAPSEVRVSLVYNEEEWRAAAGPYGHLTFAWGVTLDDGSVVVKSPEYAQIEHDRFERVVLHEINHTFWMWHFGKHGAGWSPHWVVEGIANLLAPARDLLNTEEVAAVVQKQGMNGSCLEYGYRDLVGPEELVVLYSVWRATIQALCPQGDATRLMKCLRSFAEEPSEQRLNSLIKEEFGSTLETFFGFCSEGKSSSHL